MEQSSLTALICAFSRAYHLEHNSVPIFSDSVARQLIGEDEAAGIADNMTKGISFFCPGFFGTREEALRWVMDHQISPPTLARSAFAEQALEEAVRDGAEQYLILGAGYDTFACRQPDWARQVRIFELDHPLTAADKQRRLRRAGLSVPENVHFLTADLALPGWQKTLESDAAYRTDRRTFCSLLGLVYYLSHGAWETLLTALEGLFREGSSLAFDYPDADTLTQHAGEQARKQALLAEGAGETMRAGYSFSEMESLLSRHGFSIKQHLTPEEMTERYFRRYRESQPEHPMRAFEHTNYLLAVRTASPQPAFSSET